MQNPSASHEPRRRECRDCIDWAAPLRLHVRHGAPALTYAGWILWTLHVIHHQGLGASREPEHAA